VEKLADRDFRQVFDFFDLTNPALIMRIKPLIKHYKNMSANIDDPRLKRAFTFQDI